MTIPASRFCSLSFEPRPYRLQKARARSPASLNLISCCRCRVCFVGWVRILFLPIGFSDIYPGCHVLALDLVRSWSFDRPSVVIRDRDEDTFGGRDKSPPPPSPTMSRRSMFDLASRRRSSIMIDMQITDLPPTRSASPERPAGVISTVIEEEKIKEEGDLFARKVGLGNLMKSAKQDVQVPEFDMSSFF